MPKQRGLRQKGKSASSAIRSIRNDRKKLAVVFLLVITVSSLFLFVAIPQAIALSQQSDGDMGLGSVGCTVDLETKPLKDNGDGTYSVIQTGEDGDMDNAPWFIGDQEVSAIEFIINIIAVGDYVDWSTLTVTVRAEANGKLVNSQTIPGTPLDITAGGYSEILVYRITTIDDYIDEAKPSREDEDGTKYYDFECNAVATGYIEDAKGNDLTDTVTIRHPWTLNTLPDGNFQMQSEEAIKPSFSSAPPDASVTQGDPLVLNWVANDDNPASYVIKTYTPADGSQVVAEGTWQDGDTISYDKAASYVSLEPGNIVLKVTCTLIDEDGQQTIDSVTVDITVPVVPSAPTFLKADGVLSSTKAGDVEFFITFKPRSDRPASYKIYANGVLKKQGTWSGGDIVYNVVFLYSGTNSFKCVVTDTLSQSSSYTHSITAPKDDLPKEELPYDPDDPAIAAPFSLGDVQGISIFVSIFFVGVGIAIWYIMKRGK